MNRRVSATCVRPKLRPSSEEISSQSDQTQLPSQCSANPSNDSLPGKSNDNVMVPDGDNSLTLKCGYKPLLEVVINQELLSSY